MQNNITKDNNNTIIFFRPLLYTEEIMRRNHNDHEKQTNEQTNKQTKNVYIIFKQKQR